jgi:transposase
MNRKLSTEERVFVLQKWCQHDHNYRDVVDLFVGRFPNGVPASRQTIHNLNKRFEQTGSVADRPRSGRPKSVTTGENLNIVKQSFVQSPTKSTRNASSEHDILTTRNRKQKYLRFKCIFVKRLMAIYMQIKTENNKLCERFS